MVCLTKLNTSKAKVTAGWSKGMKYLVVLSRYFARILNDSMSFIFNQPKISDLYQQMKFYQLFVFASIAGLDCSILVQGRSFWFNLILNIRQSY